MKSRDTLIVLLAVFDLYLLFAVNKLSFVMVNNRLQHLSPTDFSHTSARPRILYWSKGNRRAVQPALETLGFDEERPPLASTHTLDWLWTHRFPFKLTRGYMSYHTVKVNDSDIAIEVDIQEPSKVNHIPGITRVVIKEKISTPERVPIALHMAGLKEDRFKIAEAKKNKDRWITIEPSKYIPRTYSLPNHMEEFQNKISEGANVNEYWFEKRKSHRGCRVVHIADLELHSKSVLLQEFISNQLLIHGHAFQIGVHVIITSINPLRAYILKSNIGHRMAPMKYNSTDFSDTRTYVTDSDHAAHINDLPEFARHQDSQYNVHSMFKDYLLTRGHDPSQIYQQLIDAIVDVLRQKRPAWVGLMQYFNHFRSVFFEHMRWDFIVDSDLKVYLLEANMSPAVPRSDTPRADIAYNVLNIVQQTWANHSSTLRGIRQSDITIYNKACYSNLCRKCGSQECFLCAHCMTLDSTNTLKVSMVEHVLRGEWRRAFPEPDLTMNTNASTNYPTYTDIRGSKIETMNWIWLRTKCQQDSQYWCT